MAKGRAEATQGFAWRPDEATRRRARLSAFMERYGDADFHALHRRSVEDVETFTRQVLEFLDVRFHRPYTHLLDLERGWPWARWCVGGGLNIAASCVDRNLELGRGRQAAVVWEGEDGATRTLTYSELADAVRSAAAGLRALGIGRGDAVGLFLPMVPETVVALLALARVGAVAVPLFSGYGPRAIRTRLEDVGARAVVAADGFVRRGRLVRAWNTVLEAVEGLESLRHLICVHHQGARPDVSDARVVEWETLVRRAEGGDTSVEPTDAEDLLIVLYSSGTTGRPKGIAHTHCGFPVKGAQDMAFGTDVGEGDRILWVTDLGWMMGPWLIYGSTLLGATMVLYDGALDVPDPGRLWDVVGRHEVHVLGVSPTLVRSLAARGDRWVEGRDRSSLRILASTGEPWNPEPWWWWFRKVGGGRLPIVNYSGGTEISGGILMGNPLLPVKPCAFPAPCPGIAADVVDEEGRSVRGRVGELVIRKPWIGMARGFWKDPERYLATYWSRWPDVWVHGDWAQVDEDGQWTLLGRSDDTLNIAGKRVGPAEVESVLVSHPDVTAAAAVGVPHPIKGTALVAACVPVDGAAAGSALAEALREQVARALGRPLRPDTVLFVRQLPVTRNGKVMRRVVRAVLAGEDPGDLSALDNPDVIETLTAAAAEAGLEETRHAGP